MWEKLFRPNSRGSADQTERLIRALEEQNALLRAQLELGGAKLPPILHSRPMMPIRKRTAADVTVVTRETLRTLQDRADVKARKALPDVIEPTPVTL